MKRAFWLLLLFGLWCVACGYWYMFAVKGISQDPNFFNPHVRWVAILEILLMVLIACLIGYAIGWSLRNEPMAVLQDTVDRLEGEQESVHAEKRIVEEKLQSSRQQLISAQQSFTLKVNKARHDADLLEKEILDLKAELNKVRASEVDPVHLQQLENEVGALQFRAKQLEFQNQELADTNRKLKHELEEYLSEQTRKSLLEPTHPFVRPVEMSERDDLTLIKGIGPFIEKRLNMIGIYTFRQISEFTPEIIEHVTQAIEFFPNRIVKDDWVGQASAKC